MSKAAVDRHVYEDAANVQDLIREARARAVGRGGAVMVEMSSKGTQGTFKTYEIRADVDGGQNLPLTSCKAPTNWATASDLNTVGNADMNNDYEKNNHIRAKIYDDAGKAIDSGYLCFTSFGRAYFNTSKDFNGQEALTGALRVEVAQRTPADDAYVGIVRSILIPPTGAARLVSGAP